MDQRLRQLEFQPTATATAEFRTPLSMEISACSPSGCLLFLPMIHPQEALNGMEHFLQWAGRELQRLEHDDMLGTNAVMRACRELADVVANVATQCEHAMDSSSDNTNSSSSSSRNGYRWEEHAFHPSLTFYSSSSLLLTVEEQHHHESDPTMGDCRNIATTTAAQSARIAAETDGTGETETNNWNKTTNDDDVDVVVIQRTMQKISLLLRDVEMALRAMEEQDASDLADAALTVAQLVLLGLSHCHSQLALAAAHKSGGGNSAANHEDGRERRPTTLPLLPSDTKLTATSVFDSVYASKSRTSTQQQWYESPRITMLPSDDSKEDGESHASPQSLPSETKPQTTSLKKQSPLRIRCLWPPIRPKLMTLLNHSQEEILKHHWLLPVTLGIVFWPLVTATAVVGSTAVLTDGLLQDLYHHWENTGWITTVEYTAASLFQTSKLSWLTAKTVAKPTLRVARRQIQRHRPAVQDCIGYHISHPVETIGKAVQGFGWCTQQAWGALSQHWDQWQQQLQRQDHQQQSNQQDVASAHTL